MKKRYLSIALMILLVSCSQVQEERKEVDQNEVAIDIEVESTDMTENISKELEVEVDLEEIEIIEASKTEKKLSEIANSSSISYDDLQILFSSTYAEAISEKDENTRVFERSFFKFTSEYPMISNNYTSGFYYFNKNDDSNLSYLKVNASQEIKSLSDFGYKKEMTLAEVLELDSTLCVKKIWSGYSDDYRYYVEVIVDDFRYALESNDLNSEVWSIYICKTTPNLIELDFNKIIELITEHSEYNCTPLLFTKGDINNDGHEDIFIVSIVNGIFEEYSNKNIRVVTILLSEGNDYIKYGEVLGLIDASTGAFGPPILNVSIENGLLSISQYGGSNWRNNRYYNYVYDEEDNKIYLDSTEFSSYHNVRPVQETLTSTHYYYDKEFDILDGYERRKNGAEYIININDSKITLTEIQYDSYVHDLLIKYREKLINKIEALDVEGEFAIKFYPRISNDKVLGLCLYANGNYNDLSEELKPDEYNSYYFDSVYLNIDLEKQKELNILDYYKIDEIVKALYDSTMAGSNFEAYSITTKDDLRKVIEDSLNGTSTGMNQFKFALNDLSIKLELYLQYEDTDIVHLKETTLIRKDDLIVKSRFYEEWFGGTFQ